MLAYAFAFIASAFIGSLASASSGRGKAILVLLSCLPLALLAGLRSLSVGVDTSRYPLVTYYVALESGPFQAVQVTQVELGFAIIIWGLASLTHDYNAVLFLVQVIMLFLFAYQLIRLDSKHVGTAIFIYSCLILPWSLNLMRQALAVAFLLPAQQFSIERKPIKFLVCLILASFIHRTALIGLIIWPLCVMASSESKRMHKLLIALGSMFMAFVTLFIAFGAGLLDIASQIKSSYSYEVLGAGRFNELFTFYPVMLALLSYFVCRKNKSSDEELGELRSLNAIMLFSGCASLMSLLSETLFRVGYMFLIFAPLQVDRLLSSIPSKSTRCAICSVILLASAFVFLWAYCWGDASGSYPYHSDILGI